MKPTRYYCGNGDGMFESKTGHWIEHREHLKILKELKEQLHKHSVSGSIATEYAEFCVRCDREKLPLIRLEDYIEQYCR